VLAPRPAARPTLAFLKLLLGPANAALPGHRLLGILDPADELVAGERRDVLPGIECRRVGDQRLAEVPGKLVHYPTGESRAAHGATVAGEGLSRCPSVPTRPGGRYIDVVKASLSIAADIREQIGRGDLVPGDPLPVESDLMEELGVSKGVLREALRILENEGLIEVRRGLGGGPRVRHPSLAEAVAGVGIYLQIGDVLVSDVWEARDNLIGDAVERLAIQAPAEAGDTFDREVGELSDCVGDFDRYYVQLLNVGETAVALAGRLTDAVLVGGLRHVIAIELEAATRAAVDIKAAVAAEELVTKAWVDVARHVRAHRPNAARRAFERQATFLRDGVLKIYRNDTVVDIFRST
jgi:GntR family transcriptional repressor for pyruvate dehydrogenase complex